MSSMLFARNERYRLMGLLLKFRVGVYALLAVPALFALDLGMTARIGIGVLLAAAAAAPFAMRLGGRYSGVRLSAAVDVLVSYFIWIAVPEAAALTLVVTIWTVAIVEFFSKRSTANRFAVVVMVLELSKLALVLVAGDSFDADGPMALLIVGRTLAIGCAFVVMRALDQYLQRLNAAAETSANRYRRLMESAPTAFLVVSDGRVRYANAAGAALLSDTGESLAGKRFASLVDDSFSDRFAGQIARAEERLEPFALQGVAMRTIEGEQRFVDAAVTPIDYGNELAIQVALHDMSAQKRAESELRETKLNYRSFFERIPVALYRSRPNGEIIQANRALVELLGARSERELVGRNARSFYVDGSERDHLTGILSEQRVVVGYEARMRRLDGDLIWIRDTARLIESEIGDIYEGAMVDVTGRRNIEDELWARAVQQEAAASIGQIALEADDISLVLRSVTESVARVLRTDAAMVLERNASGEFELLGQSSAFDLDSAWVASLADRAHMTAAPVVLRSASEVEFAASPLADAGVEAALAVMIPGEDIDFGTLVALSQNERVFTAEDLNFLHTVANVLAAAIDRESARSRLEALLRSKDAFVASVSHELRTPLTVVTGMALELNERWMDLSDDELREFTGLLVEQSQDMSDLIEDLLVAARANVGNVAVVNEPIELEGHITRVLSAYQSVPGKSISADLHPGVVDGDPIRVRQILRNLITNAIRYGGRDIEVVMTSTTGAHIIEVIDDGDGIPPGDRDRIFDAYERAHNAEGQPGSVGLGLTVARTLAGLMGGSLTYAFDGRSRFRLEMSRNVDAESSMRAEADQMPGTFPAASAAVGLGRIGVDVGVVE